MSGLGKVICCMDSMGAGGVGEAIGISSFLHGRKGFTRWEIGFGKMGEKGLKIAPVFGKVGQKFIPRCPC